MCRHIAYVGQPVHAAAVLLDAPHALVTQVDHPRHQEAGKTNRDGWGLAWRFGSDWRLHRSTIPFSVDHDGQAQVKAVESAAMVAAIRRASPGLALVETGNAPFTRDGYAFSLNGFVGGFTSGARDPLVDDCSPARRAELAGDTDSELLFALVLDRLDRGADPSDALAATLALAVEAGGMEPSRLNLLLSDGATIWATRWSNSLFQHRSVAGSVVVASEPSDDDQAWTEVPDRSVVTASVHGVAVRPLA